MTEDITIKNKNSKIIFYYLGKLQILNIKNINKNH
jgi:hypothetical protein